MNRKPHEGIGKAAARYELGRRAFFLALIVYMVSSSSLSIYISFQNRETVDAVRATQQEGSPIILRLTEIVQSVEDTADQIQSCTDSKPPVGKCYAEGQRNQSAAVGSLNEVTVAASACAAGYADMPLTQRVKATRQCVNEVLNPKP